MSPARPTRPQLARITPACPYRYLHGRTVEVLEVHKPTGRMPAIVTVRTGSQLLELRLGEVEPLERRA